LGLIFINQQQFFAFGFAIRRGVCNFNRYFRLLFAATTKRKKKHNYENYGDFFQFNSNQKMTTEFVLKSKNSYFTPI